jgi:hypothetical protein
MNSQYNPYDLGRVCNDIDKLNERYNRLQQTTAIGLKPNHWMYYNSEIGLIHIMAVDWTRSIGWIKNTYWLSQSIISGGRAFILRRSYTKRDTPGQRLELHDWATLESIWGIQQERHTTGFGKGKLVDWSEHPPACVWTTDTFCDITPHLIGFFRGEKNPPLWRIGLY